MILVLSRNIEMRIRFDKVYIQRLYIRIGQLTRKKKTIIASGSTDGGP
jgi:hypothetical protein